MTIKHFVIFTTVCFFISCKKNENVDIVQIKAKKNEAINDSIQSNKKIDSFISPFKKHLNEQLDSKLAEAKADLTKTDGELVSSLGNLMADICYLQALPVFEKREQKKIDFVLFNHGGIRAPIPKGPITARNAFEVMPFENELVVVELSGTKTQELLTYLSNEMKAHPISNMELEVHQDNSNFRAIINNKSFDSTKTYHVLTSDYLQQGGDKMIFFSNPIKLYNTKYKLRNALIDYFKKTDTLKSQIDQRFTAYETKQ